MNNQNPDSTATLPEVIEHKGRIAKIYRAKNRDRYRYEVKYRDPDGAWIRETFDEPDAARKHANHVVKQLDAATQPFLMLRGQERFVYERALDLLRSTGQPLDMAIAEFVEAKSKLKDVCTLREAAETTRNLRTKPVSTARTGLANDIDVLTAVGRREAERHDTVPPFTRAEDDEVVVVHGAKASRHSAQAARSPCRVSVRCGFTQATGHPHPQLQRVVENYGALLMKMGDTQEQAGEKLNKLIEPIGQI